jgi:hypothetical protein
LSKEFTIDELKTSCGTPDYVGNEFFEKQTIVMLKTSTRSFDGRTI